MSIKGSVDPLLNAVIMRRTYLYQARKQDCCSDIVLSLSQSDSCFLDQHWHLSVNHTRASLMVGGFLRLFVLNPETW